MSVRTDADADTATVLFDCFIALAFSTCPRARARPIRCCDGVHILCTKRVRDGAVSMLGIFQYVYSEIYCIWNLTEPDI